MPLLASVVLLNAVTGTTEDIVKLRCSLDHKQVNFEWTGELFIQLPQQRQKKLFNLYGFNAGRCLKKDGKWFLTSREFMYYLDENNEIVRKWQLNEDSKEVTVLPVFNQLVQFPMRPSPFKSFGSFWDASYSVPLTYPNPLNSEEFEGYVQADLYQAIENFSFLVKKKEYLKKSPEVVGTWVRTSQILPWMNMGRQNGILMARATMRRMEGISSVPKNIKEDIEAKGLSFYFKAPTCVSSSRNVTSWTYFKRYFEEYKAGASFPMNEVPEDGCE